MAGVELMMGILLNSSVSKVVSDHITKCPPSWLSQEIIYQVYLPASLPFVRGLAFSWGTAFRFLVPFATLEGEAPFDGIWSFCSVKEAALKRADRLDDMLYDLRWVCETERAITEFCLNKKGRCSLKTEDKMAAVAGDVLD